MKTHFSVSHNLVARASDIARIPQVNGLSMQMSLARQRKQPLQSKATVRLLGTDIFRTKRLNRSRSFLIKPLKESKLFSHSRL